MESGKQEKCDIKLLFYHPFASKKGDMRYFISPISQKYGISWFRTFKISWSKEDNNKTKSKEGQRRKYMDNVWDTFTVYVQCQQPERERSFMAGTH